MLDKLQVQDWVMWGMSWKAGFWKEASIVLKDGLEKAKDVCRAQSEKGRDNFSKCWNDALLKAIWSGNVKGNQHHGTGHVNWVNFSACTLYLNKAV